jgi:hypothetical protein
MTNGSDTCTSEGVYVNITRLLTMHPSNVISTIVIFSIICNIGTIATSVSGQLFQSPSSPQPTPPSTPETATPSTSSVVPPSSTSSPSSQSNTTAAITTTTKTAPFVAHGVRITSPTKGQKVPTVGDLTITGTSKGNATTTHDCQVYVIVNGVKPYQNASATGPVGPSDYSKWKFLLTPKYTLIKEGQNKITAKFSCRTNPKVASFYSVNVIGTRIAEGGDHYQNYRCLQPIIILLDKTILGSVR